MTVSFALETNREMNKHPQSPIGSPVEVNASKELKVALQALSRVTASPCSIQETVWIQGPPGAKRTKLVQELHRELEANHAYIVRAKFDRTKKLTPYSTFANDFSQLFMHVMKSPKRSSIVAKLKEEIPEMVIAMFLSNVPNARDLFEIESADDFDANKPGAPASANSVHQFQIIARDVLRVITNELEPVVFIVEDFHLAHSSIFDFSKFLLLGNSDVRLLFVATCYNEEGSSSSDLSHFVRALDQADIRFNRLHLEEGPISRAHYVRELSNKMNELSGNTILVLEVAALLGSYFESSMLETVLGSMDQINTFDLMTGVNLVHHSDMISVALEEALSKGLIEFVANRYQFIDDTTHGCALQTLEDDPDHDLLVFRVAKIMLELKSPFLVIPALNHLNSVLHVLRPESHYKLVNLNLEGAKKASFVAAYSTAAEYLQFGLDLLGDNHWDSEYHLSLEMTSKLAEMALAARSYVGCKIAIDEVVLHAQSFADKLPVYYILIDSLRAQDRHDEAIEVGLQILQVLGEKIRVKGFRLPAAVAKLRAPFNRAISGFCDGPTMIDTETLEICGLLHKLADISWSSGQATVAIQFMCRIVHLSLKHGRSEYSAIGFAGLGTGLCLCEHFDDAQRCGELALRLSKIHPDALAEGLVYYFVDHWRHPFSNGLSHLEDISQIALQNGRVSNAMFASQCHLSLSLVSGQPLLYLGDLYEEKIDQLSRFSETMTLLEALPAYQFLLNMTGAVRDVLVLSGDAMTEESFVAQCTELKAESPVMMMEYEKMKLAYYFGNYEKAYESRQQVYKFDGKKVCPRASKTSTIFFGGLTAVEMYKSTLRKKFLQEAKKDLAKLQKWKKSGCVNAHHTMLLLEAEIAAATRASNAKELFNQAIEAATKISYSHDRALANERAGVYCLSDNDTASACEYMVEANRMYNRWEASAKVTQVKGKYPYLFYDHNSMVSSKNTQQLNGNVNPATGNLRLPAGGVNRLPTIQPAVDRNAYNRRRPSGSRRGGGVAFHRRRYSTDEVTTSDTSW
mmetsp:Transcript_17484/g.29040  ORF Transcript_17484/g.29040 Transcript_17484/m.29040 type:complete len:1027 (-) Transcript_17484:536-3616(-)|eukprot:CAMPEP_0119011602 /NCGR_PEP_ID=MMETSP1176-20130426/5777_1 /TAXON_ID=265551 /ORGANISM="Synedropsis recta cf, Strain CCMP1620" /LENGTH=1026 /DNA_ID=CAMNT_0006964457 /DNA_START=43 /DNA_END=3123 /DNA_ORIENTATION=-